MKYYLGLDAKKEEIRETFNFRRKCLRNSGKAILIGGLLAGTALAFSEYSSGNRIVDRLPAFSAVITSLGFYYLSRKAVDLSYVVERDLTDASR